MEASTPTPKQRGRPRKPTTDQRTEHWRESLDGRSPDGVALLEKLHSTNLDPDFNDKYWRVETIDVARNPSLEQRYADKRRELCQKGRTETELEEVFVFSTESSRSVAETLREGHRTGLKKRHILGHCASGVHLHRHYDVLTRFMAFQNYTGPTFVVIFKAFLGRVKPIVPRGCHDSDYVHPYPDFDCHVSAKTTKSQMQVMDAINCSFAYFYEFDPVSSNPVRLPRQILPFAVLHLSRRPFTKPMTPFLAVDNQYSNRVIEVKGETRRGFRWTVKELPRVTRANQSKTMQLKPRQQNTHGWSDNRQTKETSPPALMRFDEVAEAQFNSPPVLMRTVSRDSVKETDLGCDSRTNDKCTTGSQPKSSNDKGGSTSTGDDSENGGSLQDEFWTIAAHSVTFSLPKSDAYSRRALERNHGQGNNGRSLTKLPPHFTPFVSLKRLDAESVCSKEGNKFKQDSKVTPDVNACSESVTPSMTTLSQAAVRPLETDSDNATKQYAAAGETRAEPIAGKAHEQENTQSNVADNACVNVPTCEDKRGANPSDSDSMIRKVPTLASSETPATEQNAPLKQWKETGYVCNGNANRGIPMSTLRSSATPSTQFPARSATTHATRFKTTMTCGKLSFAPQFHPYAPRIEGKRQGTVHNRWSNGPNYSFQCNTKSVGNMQSASGTYQGPNTPSVMSECNKTMQPQRATILNLLQGSRTVQNVPSVAGYNYVPLSTQHTTPVTSINARSRTTLYTQSVHTKATGAICEPPSIAAVQSTHLERQPITSLGTRFPISDITTSSSTRFDSNGEYYPYNGKTSFGGNVNCSSQGSARNGDRTCSQVQESSGKQMLPIAANQSAKPRLTSEGSQQLPVAQGRYGTNVSSNIISAPRSSSLPTFLPTVSLPQNIMLTAIPVHFRSSQQTKQTHGSRNGSMPLPSTPGISASLPYQGIGGSNQVISGATNVEQATARNLTPTRQITPRLSKDSNSQGDGVTVDTETAKRLQKFLMLSITKTLQTRCAVSGTTSLQTGSPQEHSAAMKAVAEDKIESQICESDKQKQRLNTVQTNSTRDPRLRQDKPCIGEGRVSKSVETGTSTQAKHEDSNDEVGITERVLDMKTAHMAVRNSSPENISSLTETKRDRYILEEPEAHDEDSQETVIGGIPVSPFESPKETGYVYTMDSPTDESSRNLRDIKSHANEGICDVLRQLESPEENSITPDRSCVDSALVGSGAREEQSIINGGAPVSEASTCLPSIVEAASSAAKETPLETVKVKIEKPSSPSLRDSLRALWGIDTCVSTNNKVTKHSLATSHKENDCDTSTETLANDLGHKLVAVKVEENLAEPVASESNFVPIVESPQENEIALVPKQALNPNVQVEAKSSTPSTSIQQEITCGEKIASTESVEIKTERPSTPLQDEVTGSMEFPEERFQSLSPTVKTEPTYLPQGPFPCFESGVQEETSKAEYHVLFDNSSHAKIKNGHIAPLSGDTALQSDLDNERSVQSYQSGVASLESKQFETPITNSTLLEKGQSPMNSSGLPNDCRDKAVSSDSNATSDSSVFSTSVATESAQPFNVDCVKLEMQLPLCPGESERVSSVEDTNKPDELLGVGSQLPLKVIRDAGSHISPPNTCTDTTPLNETGAGQCSSSLSKQMFPSVTAVNGLSDSSIEHTPAPLNVQPSERCEEAGEFYGDKTPVKVEKTDVPTFHSPASEAHTETILNVEIESDSVQVSANCETRKSIELASSESTTDISAPIATLTSGRIKQERSSSTYPGEGGQQSHQTVFLHTDNNPDTPIVALTTDKIKPKRSSATHCKENRQQGPSTGSFKTDICPDEIRKQPSIETVDPDTLQIPSTLASRDNFQANATKPVCPKEDQANSVFKEASKECPVDDKSKPSYAECQDSNISNENEDSIELASDVLESDDANVEVEQTIGSKMVESLRTVEHESAEGIIAESEDGQLACLNDEAKTSDEDLVKGNEEKSQRVSGLRTNDRKLIGNATVDRCDQYADQISLPARVIANDGLESLLEQPIDRSFKPTSMASSSSINPGKKEKSLRDCKFDVLNTLRNMDVIPKKIAPSDRVPRERGNVEKNPKCVDDHQTKLQTRDKQHGSDNRMFSGMDREHCQKDAERFKGDTRNHHGVEHATDTVSQDEVVVPKTRSVSSKDGEQKQDKIYEQFKLEMQTSGADETVKSSEETSLSDHQFVSGAITSRKLTFDKAIFHESDKNADSEVRINKKTPCKRIHTDVKVRRHDIEKRMKNKKEPSSLMPHRKPEKKSEQTGRHFASFKERKPFSDERNSSRASKHDTGGLNRKSVNVLQENVQKIKNDKRKSSLNQKCWGDVYELPCERKTASEKIEEGLPDDGTSSLSQTKGTEFHSPLRRSYSEDNDDFIHREVTVSPFKNKTSASDGKRVQERNRFRQPEKHGLVFEDKSSKRKRQSSSLSDDNKSTSSSNSVGRREIPEMCENSKLARTSYRERCRISPLRGSGYIPFVDRAKRSFRQVTTYPFMPKRTYNASKFTMKHWDRARTHGTFQSYRKECIDPQFYQRSVNRRQGLVSSCEEARPPYTSPSGIAKISERGVHLFEDIDSSSGDESVSLRKRKTVASQSTEIKKKRLNSTSCDRSISHQYFGTKLISEFQETRAARSKQSLLRAGEDEPGLSEAQYKMKREVQVDTSRDKRAMRERAKGKLRVHLQRAIKQYAETVTQVGNNDREDGSLDLCLSSVIDEIDHLQSNRTSCPKNANWPMEDDRARSRLGKQLERLSKNRNPGKRQRYVMRRLREQLESAFPTGGASNKHFQSKPKQDSPRHHRKDRMEKHVSSMVNAMTKGADGELLRLPGGSELMQDMLKQHVMKHFQDVTQKITEELTSQFVRSLPVDISNTSNPDTGQSVELHQTSHDYQFDRRSEKPRFFRNRQVVASSQRHEIQVHTVERQNELHRREYYDTKGRPSGRADVPIHDSRPDHRKGGLYRNDSTNLSVANSKRDMSPCSRLIERSQTHWRQRSQCNDSDADSHGTAVSQVHSHANPKVSVHQRLGCLKPSHLGRGQDFVHSPRATERYDDDWSCLGSPNVSASEMPRNNESLRPQLRDRAYRRDASDSSGSEDSYSAKEKQCSSSSYKSQRSQQ